MTLEAPIHLKLGDLDINDGVNYFVEDLQSPSPELATGSSFNPERPGEVRTMSQYLNRWHAITLRIQSDTKDDLANAIGDLNKELTKSTNILEHSHRYGVDPLGYSNTYKTSPVESFPEMFYWDTAYKFYIVAEITVEAKSFWETALESFEIDIDTFNPNGDWFWISSADYWEDVSENGGSCTFVNGATGEAQLVTAGGADDVGACQDKSFIEVDEMHHYFMAARMESSSGNGDIEVLIELKCYDVEFNHLGDVILADWVMNEPDDTGHNLFVLEQSVSPWICRDPNPTGVVHPSSEKGEPYRFFNDTKYIKRYVANTEPSAAGTIGLKYFLMFDSEYIVGHRLQYPMAVCAPGYYLEDTLIVNGEFENFTGDAPDDWDITVTDGAADSDQETTDPLSQAGSLSILNTSGVNPATITIESATAFVVDNSILHKIQGWARMETGDLIQLEIGIKCYDNSDTLLGTYIYNALSPVKPDEWEWYEMAFSSLHKPQIHPEGTSNLVKFADGTTKIKMYVMVELDTNAEIWFDCFYIGEYAARDSFFKGDVEVLADAYISIESGPGKDDGYGWPKEGLDAFAIGQRNRYHMEYDPIRDYKLYGLGEYEYLIDEDLKNFGMPRYAQSPNTLLLNPDFELPGGFSEDETDVFDNWTKQGGGISNAYFGASSDAYSGNWSLAAVTDGVGSAEVRGWLYSDFFAISPTSTYVAQAHVQLGWSEGNTLILTADVEIKFWDVGLNFLAYTHIFQIGGRSTDGWEKYSITLTPNDIPDDAVWCEVSVEFWVLNAYQADTGASAQVDNIFFAEIGQWSAEVPVYYIEENLGDVFLSIGGIMAPEDPTEMGLTISTEVRHEHLGGILPTTQIGESETLAPWDEEHAIVLESERWDTLDVPYARLSDDADLSALLQSFLWAPIDTWDLGVDVYADYMWLIPIDQTVVIVNNWAGSTDYAIIDSRSDEPGVLKSFTGDLNAAMWHDISNWIGSPDFKISPEGINMAFCLYYTEDEEGWHTGLIRGKLKLVYAPCYLTIPRSNT